MTKKKDWDYIARLEKAIAKKYGNEAIQNPASSWDEEKEKEYLKQLKQAVNSESASEYLEKEGFLISKKLINKDGIVNCTVCSKQIISLIDKMFFNKHETCSKCYITFVEGREKRWQTGWRPENGS